VHHFDRSDLPAGTMTGEREEVTLRGLARWLVVAAFLLAGIALYFVYGRDAIPVVPSVMTESGR
jgi:hypothetical protein